MRRTANGWRVAATGVLAVAGAAGAQTITVNAVQSNTPNFGNLAAAGTGVTEFRIGTGSIVTRISGGGGVLASGTKNRSQVTIRCAGGAVCTSATAHVRLAPLATVTGRGQPVHNFTVASGTGTVGSVTPQGDGSLLLTLTGFGGTSNRTFLVGLDLPVLGDNASTATAATALWTVAASLFPAIPAPTGTNGTARATVRRGMSIAATASLGFGAIRAPDSGSGTVTIAASNGARSAGGGSPPLLIPGIASGRAVIAVSGQPSTSITLTVPTSLQLSDGMNLLDVSLVPTLSGTTTIPSGGTRTIGVGGTLTIPAGSTAADYNGSFTVSANYN